MLILIKKELLYLDMKKEKTLYQYWYINQNVFYALEISENYNKMIHSMLLNGLQGRHLKNFLLALQGGGEEGLSLKELKFSFDLLSWEAIDTVILLHIFSNFSKILINDICMLESNKRDIHIHVTHNTYYTWTRNGKKNLYQDSYIKQKVFYTFVISKNSNKGIHSITLKSLH